MRLTSREAGAALRRGLVIPAHPLAVTASRRLDERSQRALTRYYLAAGAGGLAVGVHTTQFEIRSHGLYRPVLTLVAETAGDDDRARPVLVAGVGGGTRQAVAEARVAADLGYHLGLVSLAALPRASTDALVRHVKAVSEVLPVMAFYLQPAIGGRDLPYAFWRRVLEVPAVVAVKIAPFDRYRTQDVVRAVQDAGRADAVALYTGNDDHIILDLVTPFPSLRRGRRRPLRIAGGLLGQWAFWTRRAVEYTARCHRIARRNGSVPTDLLRLAQQVTDLNGAVFDAANRFAGCLPGIHEMLRRQGLLQGRWCLDRGVGLSRGQLREIDRVCATYSHLSDDSFVREHLDDWRR